MEKVKLYGRDGSVIEREPVDARECLLSGFYSEMPWEPIKSENSGNGVIGDGALVGGDLDDTAASYQRMVNIISQRNPVDDAVHDGDANADTAASTLGDGDANADTAASTLDSGDTDADTTASALGDANADTGTTGTTANPADKPAKKAK